VLGYGREGVCLVREDVCDDEEVGGQERTLNGAERPFTPETLLA
jgi:hypothetical protein